MIFFTFHPEQRYLTLAVGVNAESIRFGEYYNEKFYKRDSVLRISKETGILFVIGTSGATNLPQIVLRNVLVKSDLVVDVNIEDNYFSDMLKNKANGIIMRQNCNSFLVTLKNEVQKMVSPNGTG